MEEFLRDASSTIALVLEAIAVAAVVFGALDGLRTVLRRAPGETVGAWLGHARLRLGRWLVLGLELQLAADVVRTAISPTWRELGQLAAVAAIRTLLNYFLTRELAELKPPATVAMAARAPT